MSESISWNELSVVIGAGTVVAGVVAFNWGKIAAIAEELADFRVEVAREYVSRDEHGKAEDRAIAEMERLRAAIERLTEKFDRLLGSGR